MSSSYAEVDVFISNYTLVDPEIYQLWVDGQSASDAVAILNQRGLGQQTGASLELIASDVLDHYRTYSLLEKLLSNPSKLDEQPIFQIEPAARQLLIAKYYDFDDSVVRELLGKKLSSKHRKDLDEISDKSGVPLRSCRRQFDNVKRIFKAVEEMPGHVAANIQQLFLLSADQAEKYACVVFLACLRFETSKRKLQYLRFSALRHCADAIMKQWTYRLPAGASDYVETEMDREFLLELRELRCVADKEKEHRHLVVAALRPQLLHRAMQDLDASFKAYSRALLGPAAGLHRARELRLLFVELSQAAETWKQNGWNLHDLELFLNAYTKAALEMDVLREAELKVVWERYMAVITRCLLIMYRN